MEGWLSATGGSGRLDLTLVATFRLPLLEHGGWREPCSAVVVGVPPLEGTKSPESRLPRSAQCGDGE